MSAIIILLSCIVFITITIVFFVIYEYDNKRIKQNSDRYKALMEINNRYKFDPPLKKSYIYEERVNSKAKYNSYNFEISISNLIMENEELKNILEQAEKQNELFQKYRQEVCRLPAPLTEDKAANIGLIIKSHESCIKREEKLVLQGTMKPVLEPKFLFTVSYTSPQGRNSYKNCSEYTYQTLRLKYTAILAEMERRSTFDYQKRIERGKMSQSLRYKIMRRDGFRCVLCGRTAEDGVKLHVDHVMPIAMGGKTEESNLRTLCADCNLGKGAKLENADLKIE